MNKEQVEEMKSARKKKYPERYMVEIKLKIKDRIESSLLVRAGVGIPNELDGPEMVRVLKTGILIAASKAHSRETMLDALEEVFDDIRVIKDVLRKMRKEEGIDLVKDFDEKFTLEITV